MHMPVAEFVQRFGLASIALGCGETSDTNCAIAGHWLYVRQCKTKTTDTDGDLKVFGFEDARDPPAKWCVIIGKGCRVGKNRRREPLTHNVGQKAFPPIPWMI